MAALTGSVAPAASARSIWPTLFASSAGTILEWYDFIIYGTAAALVFSKIFFPASDPVAGTLASLGVYAVGFMIRPLGGLLFGPLGDKFGRKPVLLATLTLMGIATTLIGLLPTYAIAGIWAPAALVILRMAQGLGAGAEYAGAILMSTEVSTERRGLNSSIPAASVDVATLVATGTFALFALLPEGDLLSWGWRVPFLLGAPLLLIGAFIRSRVPESPEFTAKVRNAGELSPLKTLFASHKRILLLAMGVNLAPALSYIYQVFTLSYVTTYLKMDRGVALTGVLIAVAASIPICLLVGVLVDKLGAKRLIVTGAILTAMFALPFFWLLNTRTPYLMWLGIFIGQAVANRMMFAAQAVFYADLFPANVRYTGIALAREFTFAFIGGPLPFIAAAIVAGTGGNAWPIALIMAALGLITTFSALAAPQRVA